MSNKHAIRATRVALASLTLLALAAAPACGPSGDGGAAGSGGGERRFLSMGTAPPGGAFFVVGGAIAEALDEAMPEREVTAEATKGSQENIRRLVAGQLDFALANSAITYFAVRGERGFDQAYPVRAMMTLAPNVALFVAPAGGDVATIDDLRGKRVSVGPAGAGFEYFIGPLLEAHGVTYDDFSPVNAFQSQAVDLLADGSVAAAFLGGAVPTSSITQAASGGDLVYVPYDADAMAGLVDRYVFFRPAVIPAGTYRGLDADYHGLDVGSMHLIVAADAPDDLVYELTRAVWENRDAIVQKHPAGRAINEKNAARDTGTEFHPGAIRFYREIGIWPAAEAAAE